MTAPSMATIAALERSLQNCSLNHRSGGDCGGVGHSATSDDPQNMSGEEDTTLELHSDVALPYQWEQCLDLKTGEIYYINWTNGMKAKEDPRKTASFGGGYYSDEDSSYESEGSSDSSPSSSNNNYRKEDHVLVVAGCKSCLMYSMLPKGVEECPKCSGLLLHMDRSENDFP